MAIRLQFLEFSGHGGGVEHITDGREPQNKDFFPYFIFHKGWFCLSSIVQ
jgi:hypothetical protein